MPGYREKVRIAELEEEVSLLKEELATTSGTGEDQTVLLIVLGVSAAVLLFAAVFLLVRNRRLQRERAKQREMAEKAQRSLESREKFVAYVNHEIRTPLNAVAGSAVLLGNTELGPKQEKYVNTIKASVDNVLVLVNDVLDLSRAESGRMAFRSVEFMIREVTQGISLILHEKSVTKGVDFKLDVSDKIPTVVKGDPAHLNQILLNLSTNAMKFTDLGSVTLKVSPGERAGNKLWVKFEVIDTGKGIRKSKLDTIFDQFEQETRHTIQHKGGSGLGLAITKQLVEQQGGRIQVESKYLEGSTFTVEIPFEQVRNSSIAQRRKVDHSDPAILDGKTIVVADDNELNREIINDLLKGENESVKMLQAASGDACMALLSEQDADLVLMDIQMPGMDGFETTMHIRKNLRNPLNEIPVIAMTAHALEDVARKCFEAGMNDFITKPVDVALLLNKIDKVFSKSSRQKLPEWKYVSYSHLRDISGGNESKVRRYLQLFRDSAPTDLSLLRESLEKKDWDAANQHIHKIKGGAAYLGDKEISNSYAKITSMNLNDTGKEELVTKVIERTELILQEIEQILSNHKMLNLT